MSGYAKIVGDLSNCRTEAPGVANWGSSSYYISPNTVGGYWCSSCGQFVADGTLHSCSGWVNQPFVVQQPQLQTRPHKCPVCEGKGKVRFDPSDPLKRVRGSFDCKPCCGTGVVWG